MIQASEVIAEMLDSSRKFNLFYIQKVPVEHIHHRPVIDGREGNSLYWLVGHLIWAEADGVIGTMGGKVPEIPWLQEFSIGKKYEDMVTKPDFSEMLQTMQEVHALALAHIQSQTDEDLELPCLIAPANWNTIRRKGYYHFIRHESFHTGQIALIAKSFGAKTP